MNDERYLDDMSILSAEQLQSWQQESLEVPDVGLVDYSWAYPEDFEEFYPHD